MDGGRRENRLSDADLLEVNIFLEERNILSLKVLECFLKENTLFIVTSQCDFLMRRRQNNFLEPSHSLNKLRESVT